MKRLIQVVAGFLIVVAGLLVGAFVGRMVAVVVGGMLAIVTFGAFLVHMGKDDGIEIWVLIWTVLGAGCGAVVARMIVWIAFGLKPLPKRETTTHD